MGALVRYEALKAALAAAMTVDEVKEIRNKAEALRAYARMANDEQLELDAAEYRVRAERRLGELMAAQRASGLLSPGNPEFSNGSNSDPLEQPITLAQAGIGKHLADRARKLAEMPEEVFEAGIKRIRDQAGVGKRISLDITSKHNAESRRRLAKELSDCGTLQPTGRKFACLYADPAWNRKAGIGNRAYENHYPTMAWGDLLAMPVKHRLLPDAWGFIWIPRAHLLALHPVEVDTPLGRTTVKMPLAWAIAQAWGFDSYSTCFVWTKTDEEKPDDHGLGLIAWDQDELLLLFKRGRGLPKPDTDKKYGSNYRARAGEHSAKPAFYRDMITNMTGGVQVLELFAREDDDNPLPPNFFTWGNQSRNTAEQPEPTDAAGNVLAHDTATGEVTEVAEHPPANIPAESSHLLPESESSTPADDGLELPAFLKRVPVIVPVPVVSPCLSPLVSAEGKG